MEEVSSKDIREYLAILRRHKVQILAVAAVLAAVAAAVAIGLPPVYRSTATILVQEQEIPPDLVRSTITSFADERIQVISQQVMTRAVLMQLVDKYGLYEKYRERATNEETVERMRKDIKLTTVDANMSDRSSGRRVNATIAFEIAYDSPYPEQAQQVVNELVTLYLNENVKARQQSVAETAAFLTQEADRLAKQIQDIEANLAGVQAALRGPHARFVGGQHATCRTHGVRAAAHRTRDEHASGPQALPGSAAAARQTQRSARNHRRRGTPF